MTCTDLGMRPSGRDDPAAATAPSTRPLRILLTNTVMLNSGVAAMVIATLALLRRTFGPATELVVYEETPAAAAKYYPGVELRRLVWHGATWSLDLPTRYLRRWVNRPLGAFSRARFRRGLEWWRAGRRELAARLLSRAEQRDVATYAGADLIVSSGGTYLVQDYDIRPRIFDFEIAQRLGRPLVLFTQSMGPFRRDASRERLRRALQAAKLILLRDEASLGHLKDLGLEHPNVHVVADCVFALDDAETIAGRFATAPADRALRVAVSLRHWPYFKKSSSPEGMGRYLDAVAAAVSRLVRHHGARVTFLSTCQGIPEYWFDDAQVADQVVARLAPDVRQSVDIDRGFHAPADMVRLLTGFDLTIATRFHMAILSLLAGTPSIAIAYKFMTGEMYARLGVPGWLADIEMMEERSFTEQVDRCVQERAATRDHLSRSVLAEHERARRAGTLLRQALAL